MRKINVSVFKSEDGNSLVIGNSWVFKPNDVEEIRSLAVFEVSAWDILKAVCSYYTKRIKK